MTFQQLEYLLEAYRTGSISGAAKNLYLAQSSVSASITSLENELGFPVFIRGKNGITPTAQGEQVLEHAARICESYRTMTRAANTACRHIRISAPSYTPLNNAFAQLVQNHAGSGTVRFSIDACESNTAIRKLIGFELDVAILFSHDARSLAVQTMLESKELQWKNLATIPVVVQVGEKHRLYERQEVGIADLENELFVDDLQDAMIYNEYLKGIIRLRPEKTVSVKHADVRNLLLAEGLAYSIGIGAPAGVTACYRLRSIPLVDVSYTLTAVTNPRSTPVPEVDAYLSLVEQHLHK